ncbi:short-chain dehydrogenase/reductase 2b isoform X1 [Selaginella moellendorffii]|uniref:short-chain dehydrogenase/reductase 2b isoform X1 n=1 Tax=Selaginella moellendorffii TaxID=88036 RepID=UPI000D1CEC58|nr:short-chain dehydrogenase/reductase 2b isoform X1 [Selaginella moellendorffii]|eukprot:XP_024517021.1 short-chain dehydrogenase/reductase 2b isoform X1 [Selaginella moellendorffii]
MVSTGNPERMWWSKDTIVLVTGANKGIGLQLVRELARRGLTTILTSRDESSGRKAIESLLEEGIDRERLVYHQLDITSPDSVDALADWVSRSYGSIEILVSRDLELEFRCFSSRPADSSLFSSLVFFQINNAGVNSIGVPDLEQAKYVVETNYYGTKRVIEAMVPLLKPGARIVNVSSKAGDLAYLKNEWNAKLEDIATLTPSKIDEMIQEFFRAVEAKEIKARGWPCMGEELPLAPPEMLAGYSLSKIALNAYARIIAEKLAREKEIFLNSMCPGSTSTAMSGFRGHSVEIGADTAVWIALLPPGTPEEPLPHGRFFMDRKDVGFSQMPVFYDGQFYKSLGELPKSK